MNEIKEQTAIQQLRRSMVIKEESRQEIENRQLCRDQKNRKEKEK